MANTTTMKQWVVRSDKNDLDGMVFVDAPVPQVGENDVLVKLHSAALNYRDVAIPKVWWAARHYHGKGGNSTDMKTGQISPSI